MAKGFDKVKKEVSAATKRMEQSNQRKLNKLVTNYRQTKSTKKP